MVSLAALLPGEAAAERAVVFLSVIAGFKLMRNILGSTSLTDDAAATRLLEAVFRALTDTA